MESTNNTHEAAQKRFRFRKRYLAIPLVCLPLFCAVAVVRSLSIGSDAAALRQSLMDANPGEWNKKIAVHLGFFTLGAVRCVSSFVPLPPEARIGLESLRNVEVGVFQNNRSGGPSHASTSLAAADRVMLKRGWLRAVCVASERELVLIYTPRDMTSPKQMSCCVAVLNERDLVVVSGRGNVEALMQLAEQKIPELRHRPHGSAGRKLLAAAAPAGADSGR